MQARIQILENYPDIQPLFLWQILSIPEKCNRLGYVKVLSQSNGYREFCSSTIKLSQNPFQSFNQAHKENTKQMSMLNTQTAIILLCYIIAIMQWGEQKKDALHLSTLCSISEDCGALSYVSSASELRI